jgi:hypothetical protein
MLTIGVTFTGEEIFREKVGVPGARALLSPLDLWDVLEFCAMLNAVNQISVYEAGGGSKWKSEGGQRLLARLLKDLLEPVYHPRAWKLYNASPRFSPLVGAAINGVIGLACRWCQERGGERLKSIRYRRNVTRVLFALQGELMNKVKLAHIADEAGLREAFPYVARSILANKTANMPHDLGRLHALVSRPEVGKVSVRKNGHSVDDWFKENIGLPVSQYQCVMTALAAYAGQFKADAPRPEHLWLNMDAFVNEMGQWCAEVRALIETAQTTPQSLIENWPEPKELADAVYGADYLLVRPLLCVANRHLVTSFEAVFANFLRGLTYLSTRVAERKKCTSGINLTKEARGGFGPIFEGYLCWLVHQWFGGTGIAIIEDYRINTLKKGKTPPQGDLLLVCDGVGYAMEVKAIVPSRQMRKGGELQIMVDKLVPIEDGTPDPNGLILQARRLAKGLVAGAAVQSDGTPIPALKKVFPIGVVFELPLPYPFTNPLESDIERACGEKAFQHSDGIAPFQMFEIEAFEELDEVFEMPSDAAAVLSALQKRANAQEFRYESFETVRGCRGANPKVKPGLLKALADESEGFVKANCKFLKPDSTSHK